MSFTNVSNFIIASILLPIYYQITHSILIFQLVLDNYSLKFIIKYYE